MGWLLAFWLTTAIWTLDSAIPAVVYLIPMLVANAALSGAGLAVLTLLHWLNVRARADRFPIAAVLTPRIVDGRVLWDVSPEHAREVVGRLRLDRRVHGVGLPVVVAGLLGVLILAGAHSPRDLALLSLGTLATLGYAYVRLRPDRRLWRRLATRLAAAHARPVPDGFEDDFDAELDAIARLRTELYGAPMVNGIRDAMRGRLVRAIRGARNEVLSDPGRLEPIFKRILDELRDYRVALEVERARRREGRRRQSAGHAPPGAAGTGGAADAPFPEDYDLLGITPDASDDELRSAYGRLAKRLHPDRDPELTSGPMSIVNAAYGRIKAHRERLANATSVDG